MADRSDLRAFLPAALALAAILVILAAVQDRWIGRWSDVEDTRLRTILVTGADALNEDLTARLGALAEAMLDVPATDASAADSLTARLDRLGPLPLPIRDVFWVASGPDARLWRLDREAGGLEAAEWDALSTLWKDYVENDLVPDASGAFHVDTREMPGDLPTLLLPALTSPEAAFRFVVVHLDTEALAESTLPALVRDHLPIGASFDLTLRRTASGRLDYASGDTLLTAPDLTRPVGTVLTSRLAARVLDAGGTRVVEVDQSDLTLGDGLWRLDIQHRAGSIGAAVAGLRWRQRGLALAILLVLGGAVALLVRSALAQRRLARRQMAFVAGVSHELRTPLAVLGSAGENLADGVVTSPEAVLEYGGLVRDESRRLAETVESVLALGGVDARAPSRGLVDLREVVARAVQSARGPLAETSAAVEIHLPDDLPEVVADEMALTAAVRNLVVNAARHGGPHIEVSAYVARGHIEVRVDDDGPGPLAETDVFEPFVRGEGARGTPGSGLGLALVRRVAESHGGAAALARTPEARTRATLSISRSR